MSAMELSEWEGKLNEEVRIDCTLEALAPGQLIDCAGGEEKGNATRVDDEVTVINVECEEASDGKQANYYRLASWCGVIAGAIDSLWVGRFDLDRAREWGSGQIDAFVIAVARMDSEYKGDDLKSAIRFLEKMHPFVGDKATQEFGGGYQHHLRDFSHHMSLGGLAFSILTQFTGKVYGTDRHGEFLAVPVERDELIGGNLEEKLMLGVVGWFFHMVSDMAGSSGSVGKGTGTPGPVLSLVKELSALPLFKDAMADERSFRKMLSKLFNGTLLKDVGEGGERIYRRFDLRAELGVGRELARQSVPVIINECLVCVCYTAQKLYEMCSKGMLDRESLMRFGIDTLLPNGSAVAARMVTIATGVFSLFDVADGVIRALVGGKSKIGALAVKDFFLHVNFVGIARFAFAVRTDYQVSSNARKKAQSIPYSGFENRGNGYGDDSSVMRFFEMDLAKTNMLVSIEYQALLADIEQTKKKSLRAGKEQWLQDWERDVSAEFTLFSFEELREEAQRIQTYSAVGWQELVALEASQFVPYQFMSEGSGNKTGKKLKFDSETLDEVCDRLPGFEKGSCRKYAKAIAGQEKRLKGVNETILVGAVGSVCLITATGGAAFVLAPTIAPVLAGSTVAGLSGAALTSASLAAVGGGSLAAGGLGVAGGTDIIAGGGALVGAAAGGGATTLGTWIVSNQDAYVLNTCAKLTVFCRNVLLNDEQGKQRVTEICQYIRQQIWMAEAQLGFMSQLESLVKKEGGISLGSGRQAKRDRNEAVKGIEGSMKNMKNTVKYMKACEKQLKKIAGIDRESEKSSTWRVAPQIESQ